MNIIKISVNFRANPPFSVPIIVLGLLLFSCGRIEKPPEGRFYEIYDRVLALYYKEPRNPRKALQWMEWTCHNKKEEQALSCYNWGVLLESEGRLSEARQAYRQAVQIEDQALFRSASEAMHKEILYLQKTKTKGMKGLIMACRNNRRDTALQIMEKMARKGEKMSRPAMSLFRQPFIRDCLQAEKRYQTLLNEFPRRNINYIKAYRRYTARRHSFRNLWNIEAYLKGKGTAGSSRHPLHQKWTAAQKAIRQDRQAPARKRLLEFFSLLRQKQQAASSKPERRRIRALGRATSLLLRQDRFFRRLRLSPELKEASAFWLR